MYTDACPIADRRHGRFDRWGRELRVRVDPAWLRSLLPYMYYVARSTQPNLFPNTTT